MTQKYLERLIEVDPPIKRISADARRKRSIRDGHILTLHIRWPRRRCSFRRFENSRNVETSPGFLSVLEPLNFEPLNRRKPQARNL
jgi:hypothetical protein